MQRLLEGIQYEAEPCGWPASRRCDWRKLDAVSGAMIVDEGNHGFNRRSSSAAAKYADALRRISLTWRSSRFSRSSAFSFAATSDGMPCARPASRSAFFTHSNSVCEHAQSRAQTDLEDAREARSRPGSSG